MDASLLLWLLLPVAALSGWLSAKRSLSYPDPHSRQLSANYLRGLNYLLNEQPDQAIDIFIKLIEVNSETVETHLALGSLFRRRGEVNRAIRIHHNLMMRSTLNPQYHALAMLELGLDYQHAGLLDRAEHLFQTLIGDGHYKTFAYRQLLLVYQQEQDWGKAIQIAWQLAEHSGETLHRVVAQYHCELAQKHRQQGLYEQSLLSLKKALQVDPDCVRASLLEGQLALDKRYRLQAIEALRRIEHQDPVFLSEAIEALHICYREEGQLDLFREYLQRILRQYGGISAMLALARLIREQAGDAAALAFVVKHLHERPSLRGLDYCIDLSLSNATAAGRENLSLFKEITAQLLKNRPIYKCRECGFSGKTLHWQCPSCKQWHSTRPIQGLEGE